MFHLSRSFSQSLSALLRPCIGAAVLAGSGSWRSRRPLLVLAFVDVMPRLILAVVGAALVAWAVGMLAVIG